MHPVIVKFGPFILYSFSLMLGFGLLLGSFVVWKHGREEYSEDKIFDAILITFISSLIVSRVVFVLSHFDFFGPDLIRWVLFTHYPGFSFWGGYVGAMVGLLLFLRSKEIFLKFLDLFSLGLSLVMVFGDIGCHFGGCVVGKAANLPWAVISPGYEGKRHPLALYLFLVDLVAVFLVFKVYGYLKNRKDLFDGRMGFLSLFYISLFFTTRGVAEFYKEKALMVRDITFLGAVLVISGVIGLVIFYKRIGRSFKADFIKLSEIFKKNFGSVCGKINDIRKKRNAIFLLNDSLREEKISKSDSVAREDENGPRFFEKN